MRRKDKARAKRAKCLCVGTDDERCTKKEQEEERWKEDGRTIWTGDCSCTQQPVLEMMMMRDKRGTSQVYNSHACADRERH